MIFAGLPQDAHQSNSATHVSAAADQEKLGGEQLAAARQRRGAGQSRGEKVLHWGGRNQKLCAQISVSQFSLLPNLAAMSQAKAAAVRCSRQRQCLMAAQPAWLSDRLEVALECAAPGPPAGWVTRKRAALGRCWA